MKPQQDDVLRLRATCCIGVGGGHGRLTTVSIAARKGKRSMFLEIDMSRHAADVLHTMLGDALGRPKPDEENGLVGAVKKESRRFAGRSDPGNFG